MGVPIASADRKTIRQTVGYRVGAVIVSTASGTGSSTTLPDTIGLARGGADEYNGAHLQVNKGANNTGLKRWVTDFNDTTKTLTFAALTDAIASGDDYELWSPPYNIDHINSLIAQAERIVTPVCYVEKMSRAVYTQTNKNLYSIPSGFVAISSLEYPSSTGTEVEIDDCDTVWSELVDGDVTASIDTVLKQEGSGCLKLVVAAPCAAGDILATQVSSALDLSGCTEVEIWIHSTVALSAGDIQLLLDNTAQCASPLETLNIPATTANTWTRHVISLANPQSDTAIISVGLKMVVDKGAFTLYADHINAVDDTTRVYAALAPNHWDIVRGSTDYLHLKDSGLSVTGTNKVIRVRGYQALTAMSADTSTSEIDPGALVDWVSGVLLLENSKGIDYRAMTAARDSLDGRLKQSVSTSFAPGTRFI